MLAGLFALGLAASSASLVTPLLGKAFVDAVSGRRDFTVVPKIAAALVALAGLDLLLGTLSRCLHARLSAAVLADLRASLFARCLTGPLDRIESLRHGDLLTRFGTDLPRVQTLLVDGLLGAAQNALFLVVAAIVTVRLSPPLALWSFLGLGLALAATAAFRGPVERRTRRVRDAMVDLSHFFSERLGAARPIRLHRTEAEELERLSSANARLTAEVVGFQVLDSLSTGLPGLLLTLSLAWIYLLGGRLLATGAITLGTFVAFVLYQGRLFAPAQGILGLVRSLQESRVSLARVAELLEEEAEAPPAADRTDVLAGGAVALAEVSFSYPGKPPVLRAVSVEIARGEKVALFGASGAGKSTLIQLLFGLRRPGSGSIAVDGMPPEAFRAQGLRAWLGYAGAEPFLLHASVEENLRYGNPGASSRDVERAARLAEAEGFVRGLPEGFRTVIGGRGLALSDGQRQRIGLGRLILSAPRILVLDEAFSGLDLDTETRVRQNLWAEFRDRTALVITHRPVGLGDFDRLLLLEEGRVLEVAPHELMDRLLAVRGSTFAAGRPWPRGDGDVQDPQH
jgi:ABC-type multidrug transport system fused ATPase/permease subunit